MKVAGYGIDAWLFLAFIVFIAIYPVYAIIRSIADGRRDKASPTKPANAAQSDFRHSRSPAPGGTSSAMLVAGRPRPTHHEVRDLIFRREVKPLGTGVFTLGYPSPHGSGGREWVAGMHQWFSERASAEMPLQEDQLNRSAISFIRRYYPSAEWVGRPTTHMEDDPKWPLVTTGQVRVSITDHQNR